MQQATNARLGTTIIYSSNMERLAAFYKEGLQLDNPEFTMQDHIGFRLGDHYFGFDQREPYGPQPGAITLWFTVDDIERTFQMFTELGARVQFKPTQKPWGAILAAIYDPDGNIVGLDQRMSA